MARRATPLIAGNWKLFKGPAEAASFCSALAARLGAAAGADVVVCPPHVSLAAAAAALAGSRVRVFAQNAAWQETGALTGEVSPAMLLEAGAVGTIVGHSERRQQFGDTDETVVRRAAHALEAGLDVIACVGELEAEREAGETGEVLRRQVGALAAALGPHERLTLAYEPVWAIGTGRTATPEQAQGAHALIRGLLDVPILYGGSVKPDNAAELLSRPDVDGALVGGASLDVESFAGICAAAGG
ncbi:MAG: triose-phosphate isomerase [Thermoleophilia bacterium]|nr:triose-phosphate isomerase [Thermoleophilia bacterium]